MKIFVTGPFSRIGSRIIEAAQKNGMKILGLDSMAAKRRIVDVTDEKAVFEFFRQEAPDLVVHTAAMTDVDGCEKDPKAAQQINVFASACIARASARFGARLIALSTDYVFDGRKGPYLEEDEPCPINVYGATKLESEESVAKILPEALIVRICVPYDWNLNARPNFLMWAVEKLRSGEKIKALTDQWSTPSCVPHIVRAILDLAQTSHRGVVHLSDRDHLNRLEFVRLAAKIFDLDVNLIEPCLTADIKQIARRPPKGGLKVGKVEKLLGYPMLSVREGLSLIKNLLN